MPCTALPLLYIHGFASSGKSNKGTVLRRHFPRVCAPSLSHIPDLAVDTLEQSIDLLGGRCVLVGSSLGGFYARYLAARHGLPAVLVNPALDAPTLLRQALGERVSYHDGSRFEWTEKHLAALECYRAPSGNPPILLLVQLGDELIDHRQTMQALPEAEVLADPGGDHGFGDFETKLPRIADFVRRCT